MGWTSTHRAQGAKDRDWWQEELGRHRTIVACATVKGTFYAAVKNDDTVSHAPGKTWGLIILQRWSPKSDYNFSYKEMDETSGPYYYDAPAAVLDALSPTENPLSLVWRNECRKKLAARAKRPRISKGDTVKFEKPIKFTSGAELDTFTFVGRNIFSADGRRYRIGNWHETPYTVVSRADRAA